MFRQLDQDVSDPDHVLWFDGHAVSDFQTSIVHKCLCELRACFQLESICIVEQLGMMAGDRVVSNQNGAMMTAPSERIRIVGGEVVSAPWAWITLFTVVGGLVGLAICTYLAPIFMTVRSTGALRDAFRMRGMIAGWLLGFLVLLEVPVALVDAPRFAEKLFLSRSLLCVALAVGCGLVTQALLWKRSYLAAQIAAAGTVALILLGFGAAMHPDLILGELSIAAAAAPRATFLVFFAVLPFGAVLLAPSLVLLYWTFRGTPNPKEPPQ
jgi:cytochrome d ubiquinol oxidase subunit II